MGLEVTWGCALSADEAIREIVALLQEAGDELDRQVRAYGARGTFALTQFNNSVKSRKRCPRIPHQGVILSACPLPSANLTRCEGVNPRLTHRVVCPQ